MTIIHHPAKHEAGPQQPNQPHQPQQPQQPQQPREPGRTTPQEQPNMPVEVPTHTPVTPIVPERQMPGDPHQDPNQLPKA